MVPAALMLLLAGSPNSESAAATVRGGGLAAQIDSATGRIARLQSDAGKSLLAGPLLISVRDETSGSVHRLGQGTPNGSTFEQALPGLVVSSEIRGGSELKIELVLRSRSAQRQGISVFFDFSALPRDASLFVPAANSFPPRNPRSNRTFGYRADGSPIVIPMVAFSSVSSGAGLTAFSQIEIPTQAFEVQLQPSSGPRIGRLNLRVEPGAEVRTHLCLVANEPDWRAALAQIRDRYSQMFNVHHPAARESNGSFVWAPLVSEGQIKKWPEQRISWAEIHFAFPFVGEFVASKEPWTPALDDQWQWEKLVAPPELLQPKAPFSAIRRFMEQRLPPWETFEMKREYMRALNRHGMKAFVYFQPTTCWEPFALEKFPEDLARDRNGELVPDWLEDICLNPRPGSRWAQYLEDQFQRMLAVYPEAGGVYMDQSHFDFLDFAHDDGFTMVRGRTAYRMGYAVSLLTHRLADYARKLGKVVWWGGPWLVEMAAAADGHLSEASESLDAIKYLGLGNKTITSGASSADGYERALLAGAQPAAPILSTIAATYRYAREVPAEAEPPADELALFRRYRPLFDELRQREWVLHPRAVEVAPPFAANIFRQPGGNYVVPIVTDHGDNATGDFFDVAVRVRVPDAGKVRAARLLRPECDGALSLPFSLAGETVSVVLPRHRRASLLMVETGETQREPGQCAEPVLEAGWSGTNRCYAGEPCTIKLFVANRGSAARSLALTGKSDTLRISRLPPSIEIAAGGRRTLTVRITGAAPGLHTLRFQAGDTGADVPVPVWRERLSRDGEVISAKLEFEGWVPDGSPDMRNVSFSDQFHAEGQAKPVSPPIRARAIKVAGQLAGYMPSLNQRRWRNLGPRLGETPIPMQIKLPPAVLAELRRSNEVVFEPDTATDEYRLRKVGLRFRFADGSTVFAPAAAAEYSTLARPGVAAAPIRIRLTIPE